MSLSVVKSVVLLMSVMMCVLRSAVAGLLSQSVLLQEMTCYMECSLISRCLRCVLSASTSVGILQYYKCTFSFKECSCK